MSDRPVIPGDVLGWRSWDLHERAGETPRLMSPHQRSDDRVILWPTDRWAVARCDRGCEEIPGDDCACGLYALQTVELLRRRHVGEVCGQVALAGKVIPGADGWRAERLRPVRLYFRFDQWEIAAAIGELYGVPADLRSVFYELEEVEL